MASSETCEMSTEVLNVLSESQAVDRFGMRFSFINDSMWQSAFIEPFGVLPKDIVKVENTSTAWSNQCSTCNMTLSNNRTEFITHYRSNLHNSNAKRRLDKGYVELNNCMEATGLAESFDTNLVISDDKLFRLPLKKIKAYFVCENIVYSIYQCILHPSHSVVSGDVFRRPFDCAIILLTAGHFAAGIFHSGIMVVHKTLHRYVVRAKRGTSQNKADERNGTLRSAGAQLRRHNTNALRQDIGDLIHNWSNSLEIAPLVYIRCTESDRSVFFSEKSERGKFLKSDSRLRRIPFVTHRARVREVTRIWHHLQHVYCHGTVSEFYERLRFDSDSCGKQLKRCGNRKLLQPSNFRTVSSDSDDFEADRCAAKQAHIIARTVVENVDNYKESSESSSVDYKLKEISEFETQLLYTYIRLNSVDRLKEFFQRVSPRRILYIKFPPNDMSLLHVAAQWIAKDVLVELIAVCCDPSQKDNLGRLPYQLTNDRKIQRTLLDYSLQNREKFSMDDIRLIQSDRRKVENRGRKKPIKN